MEKLPLVSTFVQDVRHALRVLLKRPGYLATALLTLALGIGFTTATFSVVNAVLLRPLPYAAPERLVQLRERKLPTFPEFSVSPGHYRAWKEQATAFEGIAAWRTGSVGLAVGTGMPERVRADRVTWDLFPVLGVHPAAGRGFVEIDDEEGAPRTVVLAHAAWQSRFGGRLDAIGTQVRIDGAPATIVGVMPEGFSFGAADVELWMPMAFTAQERETRGSHFIAALARMKPGVTVERAREDLNVVARRLAQSYPDTSAGWEVLAFPLHDFGVRSVREPLLVLFGAVALVLLVACVNVANLLLARGAARQRELAIRSAIGASRGRLVRQLLAEQVVVSVASTAAGILLAGWLLRAVLAALPGTLPRQEQIGLDAYVLGFACALAAVTPLVFGLLPAARSSRPDLRDLMAAGGRGATQSSTRLREGLVVAEIALAMLLLVGAGLLMRSFSTLSAVPTGFDPTRSMVVGLNLPGARYADPTARERFYGEVLQRVAALPSVQAAGLSQSLPMVNDFIASAEIEGRPVEDRSDLPTANFYSVSAGYLQTMGIPVLRGRGLASDDARAGSTRVVLINETFASRVFGGGDPIGTRIRVNQGPGTDWREIVGVVGDVKQYGLAGRTTLQVYEPYVHHMYLSAYNLVVRTHAADPTTIVPELRAIVGDLDPDLPLARVRRVEEIVDASIGPQRFSAVLSGTFGGAALLLSAIGVYGVIAYTVGLRRQEFAIRMAHGARASDLLRLVLRGAAALSLAGIAVGMLAAWLLKGVLDSLLFNVSAADPATYLLVAGVLGTTALAASAVPALRATRVNPVEALRGD